MSRIKADNRGFSLVEIIIVVAIISVLIGTVGYGLSFSSGKPAEDCAQKTVSMLQHARTLTMGKYKVISTITVKKETGEIVLVEQVYSTEAQMTANTPETTETVIGAKGVKLEYSYDAATYTQLDDSGSLVVEFSRSTGALKPTGGESSTTYLKEIRVSKANTTRTIEIAPLTGRVEICY